MSSSFLRIVHTQLRSPISARLEIKAKEDTFFAFGANLAILIWETVVLRACFGSSIWEELRCVSAEGWDNGKSWWKCVVEIDLFVWLDGSYVIGHLAPFKGVISILPEGLFGVNSFPRNLQTVLFVVAICRWILKLSLTLLFQIWKSILSAHNSGWPAVISAINPTSWCKLGITLPLICCEKISKYDSLWPFHALDAINGFSKKKGTRFIKFLPLIAKPPRALCSY